MGGYEAAAARRPSQIENAYTSNRPPDRCRHRRDRHRRERHPGMGHGVLCARASRPGDRILTAPGGVRQQRHRVPPGRPARTGAVLEVVDNDESGQVSVADVRRRLSHAGNGNLVKLIAITHVPTQGGLVNPAE